MTFLKTFLNGAWEYLKRNGGLIMGFLAICAVIIVRSPFFLTEQNIFNVLRQISTNMFMASGITMILISGGIDLSGGANIAFTGAIAATLVGMGIPLPLVLIICLACGALIGFINGTIIANTTLPAFIVTYSMQNILRGATYVYTHGETIRIHDRTFIAVGTGYLWKIPLPVIYMIVVILIVSTILYRTRLGRHIYAVGGNVRAAEFSGINIRKVRVFVYIFMGTMASLAGIVVAARNYSGNPVAGTGTEMDAIGAVVLGGGSMGGGFGFIGSTLIGALLIGLMNNGLNLMRIDSYWQIIAKGVIILVAVYVDYVKNTRRVK